MVHQRQSIYFCRFRVQSIRSSLLYIESFSGKDEDDLEDPPEPLADLYLFIGGIKVHVSIKVSKNRGRISHIVSLSMASIRSSQLLNSVAVSFLSDPFSLRIMAFIHN